MFELPALPYEYNALEPFIDAKTMTLHHDMHHATYLKNLNEALSGNDDFLRMPIEKLLANLNLIPENVRQKVRNNGGGHANHSLFWNWMSTPTGQKPAGELLEKINLSFGDFEKFKEVFKMHALARFGSGWVWLISENDKLKIVDTPNQDTPLMEGIKPILGLDVWEHAYYLKYQNRRAEYVDSWWNVVNWNKVSNLYV